MKDKTDTSVVKHVGVIMDGNGRWAQKRGLPRSAGHQEGLNSAKRFIKAARDRGIEIVTLYTFSTENWNRSADEVSFLMKLLKSSLRKEYQFYRDNQIRVLHSGDLSVLLPEIRDEIIQVERDTREFDGMTVNLAINHGGRDEILRAVQNAWLAGIRPDMMTEDDISRHLDQPMIPDIDLVIRTGGEQRMSNFMLWRSSYSELYFSETLWPDYRGDELDDALTWFAGRQRRFGTVNEAEKLHA